VRRNDGQPGNRDRDRFEGGGNVTDILKAGESLRAGQELVSNNGQNRLIMQYDGNLVVYIPTGPRWDTGTWALPLAMRPNRLDMQADGNIALFNDQNFVAWEAHIATKGGTHLAMQDDSNLVVYRDDNSPVWATNTRPVQAVGEVKAYTKAEVAWAKHTEVWATMYRNGSLVVNTKSKCDAPISGYRPNTLIVAVDGQGRLVWASQTLHGDTLCAVLDPTCNSSGTDTFQEQWPNEIAQIVTRLDIFPSDNGIYGKWRQQIKEAGEAADDLKDIYAKFWT
jgi:hypothetical protein